MRAAREERRKALTYRPQKLEVFRAAQPACRHESKTSSWPVGVRPTGAGRPERRQPPGSSPRKGEAGGSARRCCPGPSPSCHLAGTLGLEELALHPSPPASKERPSSQHSCRPRAIGWYLGLSQCRASSILPSEGCPLLCPGSWVHPNTGCLTRRAPSAVRLQQVLGPKVKEMGGPTWVPRAGQEGGGQRALPAVLGLVLLGAAQVR